ncbi:hypothetical protein CEXT_492361 [Caerostris extrusa]|uniref:Uncharacterized protein n=1 Tax=Caerostris extrusa TaxID=172846 RepID=A0AAV4QUL7_CAEEX|nr:hypothetical protein CEXT_492361 [Caerostris extrusa]
MAEDSIHYDSYHAITLKRTTSTGIRDIEKEKQKCVELVNTVQDIKPIEENICQHLGRKRLNRKRSFSDETVPAEATAENVK